MQQQLNAVLVKAMSALFGAIICIAGVFCSKWVNNNEASIQANQVQLLQIQKDIKNIEVMVSAINAKQVTAEQARIIATEVAVMQVNAAILEHVRKAHEQK